MDQKIMAVYSRILKSEPVAAMGCTEPIAIAYAAAKAKEVLGRMPDHCHVHCSGNIVKNVMGVTVPNSGGLKEVRGQGFTKNRKPFDKGVCVLPRITSNAQ